MTRKIPFLLLAAVLLAVPATAPASPAELGERVRRCADVFRELRSVPDREIPDDLMVRARCVAVIPNVLKASFIVGGRHGRGVMSCRTKTGEWSPPVHVQLTGGSFGFQAGASSTDVVLFFMTTESVRSILRSKVSLAGEAGVAAGPVGREAQAGTDGRFAAQIYSYARSRGLFAGVALSGGYLGVDEDDTSEYYGQPISASGVLFEHKVSNMPKSAWTFLGALPKPPAPKAPAKKAPAPKTSSKSSSKKK